MSSLPINVYSAQQVREFDRIAIEEYGMLGITLMHRAAQAVFEVLIHKWPNARTITVFCGAGNNAGDGYLIATLALQAGFNVTVYALMDSTELTGDALTASQIYQQANGVISAFSEQFTEKPDVIVDALLGTGLNRSITGQYAKAITVINAEECPVLAVDIASGLQADTGNSMGCAVKANVTVTFIAQKQGLFTAAGTEYSGDIVFADLAVPHDVLRRCEPSAQLLQVKPLPRRPRHAHKGHFGHVLVIGGEVGFSGAARLAGQAALRTGAGLVSIATRAVHAGFLNTGCYELMCHAIEHVAELEPLLEKASVLVLGTGLGQAQWGQSLFEAVIGTTLPLIVDADGLNRLAKSPMRKDNWVLTPHPKEAARLLQCETSAINANRFAAIQELQQRYGGVCLLKGAGTLICDGQNTFINTTGNAGMASGGMGDVLAGIIAGLIAQGYSLTEATQMGVYYHGAAADLAAAEQGERGLLASDLWPYLRKLLN